MGIDIERKLLHITLPFLFIMSHSGPGKGRIMKKLTFAKSFTVLKAFFTYYFLILQLFHDTGCGDVLLFLLVFHC